MQYFCPALELEDDKIKDKWIFERLTLNIRVGIAYISLVNSDYHYAMSSLKLIHIGSYRFLKLNLHI